MVSEVVVRETMAPDEYATTESPTPKIVGTVVASLSKEVAKASTAPVEPWSCPHISQFLLMLSLVPGVSV
jgi:hypothetical protein